MQPAVLVVITVLATPMVEINKDEALAAAVECAGILNASAENRVTVYSV